MGIGNMLPSLATAQMLGFVLRNNGTTATKEQIKTDWDKVSAETGNNKRAVAFAKITLLDLPVDTCWELPKKRIDHEFLTGLKKLFSSWDSFPTPAKRALLDMAYNLGLAGFRQFKNVIKHAKKGEWDQAADACNRQGIPKGRNDWTEARFREAMLTRSKK